MPPEIRSAVVMIEPLPDAAPQLEPADAVQLHVAPLSVAGNVSVITAPVTFEGPLLVATIE